VRDLLLGNPPKDLDLVCKGAGEVAAEVARRMDATLVPMEKKPDEPCYRLVDRKHPDAVLDIAEMRGRDIGEDLRQRDFTINAIAMEVAADGAAGKPIDPLHGAEDIAKKTIRMVGMKSFVADPLRILRAVRLAAVLEFLIEDATLREMKDRAGLLAGVSAERVVAELFMILGTGRSSVFFGKMDDLGILEVLFPEIRAMKGCGQNGYHHKDVWGHSLLVIAQTEHILNGLADYFGEDAASMADSLSSGRAPLLKLASVLHDVGKPGTKGVRPDGGRITFYGHDKSGAGIMGDIAGRLKLPNRSRDFLVSLVAEHLRPLMLSSRAGATDARVRWFRKMRDDAVPALILSMADVMSSLGPESGEDYRRRFIDWAKESMHVYCRAIRPRMEAPLLITGHDLIAMGMEPGIALGNLLYRIRFAQDIGKITSRDEAMSAAREMVRRRAEGRQETG
jgi:tRNA nucleotidyltransferase/poly(A) polymerase